MILYDAHNHLQDEWLAPHLSEVADQLSALGLEGAIVNGTSEADWERVAELSARFAWAYPSFGLHPWDVGNRTPDWEKQLLRKLDTHPRAGIGEIGIDRWILDSARPDDRRLTGLRRAPLDEQLDVFQAQLRIAADRNLPASIHCLDAWGALSQVMQSHPFPRRGFLLHAYNGPAELAKAFADHGAYFSFNGNFLEPRKTRQRDTFKQIPLDRLLVETDAPAMPLPPTWRTHKLPPAPSGDAVNHPGNIEGAYHGLATLLGIELATLAKAVGENFGRLFGDKQPGSPPGVRPWRRFNLKP